MSSNSFQRRAFGSRSPKLPGDGLTAAIACESLGSEDHASGK
jgi:hypothetical protein